MNVVIQIHYITNNNKVMRNGSFPLRGKKKFEEVAFEWWKLIKREMPFGADLEKVIVEGEDLTQLVMELDKAPLED